jgi:CrcB protein
MRTSGRPFYEDPDQDAPVATGPLAARPRRADATAVGAVAVGGAIGAVSRYAVSLALPTSAGAFPWATFIVNLSGSAVLGFVLAVLVERFPGRRVTRAFLGTGIIGGYTTFSTYAVESVQLWRAGHAGLGVTYAVASVAAGALVCLGGIVVGRLVARTGRVAPGTAR